jgi:hypothetical protein
MLVSCNKTSLLQKMKDLAPACQNGEHRRQLSPTSKISKDGLFLVPILLLAEAVVTFNFHQ